MKYSSIARPSRKLLLIGRGMKSPRGLVTRPRMPAIWRICSTLPRAPEFTIISIGLKRFSDMTLAIGDDPALELRLDLLGFLLVALEDLLLVLRRANVVDRERHAGLRGVAERVVL